MTEEEWKMLAERFEHERRHGKFSQHTNDVLAALRNVAIGMAANIFLSENKITG